MRKALFLFIFLLLISIVTLIIIVGNQKLAMLPEIPKLSTRTELPKYNASQSPNFPNILDLSFNENAYLVAFEKVSDSKNLILIPNFQQKQASKEVMSANKCLRGVNGGFYTKASLPLGLFVTDGKLLGTERTSSFTDGFFWIDSNGVAYVDIKSPQNLSVPFILQSGPMLKTESTQAVKLVITNDKPARRTFLGIDEDRNVFFFTIFEKGNVLSGPYLANMPDILNIIEEKLKISLIKAINLDGGTASTFWSNNISLNEVALVGSFLCEKSPK